MNSSELALYHPFVQNPGREHACAAPSMPRSSAEIDRLADELAALIRSSELGCALEVGRLVAERVFDGDPGGWHRKGPKTDSLARLAAALAARGAGSASALHLCLGVYETLRTPGVISTWKCLSRSHVRAVLPLPLAERGALLEQAEKAGWSVRRLEEAVRKSPREHRLGRRRQPAFYRAARAVIAALAPKGPAFEELERVAELPAEHAEKLYRDLTDAAERLERLLSHLRPKGVATFRERVAHASAQAARRSWGGPRAAIRAASGQSR